MDSKTILADDPNHKVDNTYLKNVIPLTNPSSIHFLESG